MPRTPRTLYLLTAVLLGGFALQATTTTIDFEGLAAGTIVTNQYPGLYFTNAEIVSPNPLEFPAHSGVNSLLQVGPSGEMEIQFSTPVTSVSAYFDYKINLALEGEDANSRYVASGESLYVNNLPHAGGGPPFPNERIELDAPSGISSVGIYPFGGAASSFTIDDLTFTTATVPEIDPDSSAGALALLAGGLLIFRGKRNQAA